MSMRLLRDCLHGGDDQGRFSCGLGILLGPVPGRRYPPKAPNHQPIALLEFFLRDFRMKPLCDICGTRHEAYQGHVFVAASRVGKTFLASNAVSNRSASNNVAKADRPRVRAMAEDDLDKANVSEAAVRADAPTKQRWSREAYNAYQRDLMRADRAKKRAVSMS